MQTIKRLLKKAIKEEKDLYISILEYRNTPVVGTASPAQLLMNRRLRSIIPSTTKQLELKLQNQREIRDVSSRNKLLQKIAFDKHSKPLKPLHVGNSVSVRMRNGTWEPAVITDMSSTPRSYVVQTENGEYRRNRKDLRQVPTIKAEPDFDIEPTGETTIDQVKPVACNYKNNI